MVRDPWAYRASPLQCAEGQLLSDPFQTGPVSKAPPMRGTRTSGFDLEAQSERHTVSLKRHIKELNLADGRFLAWLELVLPTHGGQLPPKDQPQKGRAGEKP